MLLIEVSRYEPQPMALVDEAFCCYSADCFCFFSRLLCMAVEGIPIDHSSLDCSLATMKGSEVDAGGVHFRWQFLHGHLSTRHCGQKSYT